MSFTEWRVALWRVLHATHSSRPSRQPGRSGSFREDVFVFTWLRLQKAIERLLLVVSESGGQLNNAMEFQRLQGIGNQVRCPGSLGLASASPLMRLSGLILCWALQEEAQQAKETEHSIAGMLLGMLH